MHNGKRKICWITPDYFLNVDARVVPRLAATYQIEWILIVTSGSQRSSDGLLSGTMRPREYHLRYRQRDPRIVFQYIELLSSIQKEGYDLLYTSFHGLPFFFPLLSCLMDCDKLIYGVHNVDTPRGASNEWAMRLYQRYAFSVIKHFQVFSKYQLRTITKLVPSKHHYYAPLAPDDYGPSTAFPPNDKVRFLFFGYIRRYKRLDLLIKAFQALYSAGVHNIDLVIAGKCDEWDHYEPLIDPRAPITTMIGTVLNGDIPDLISSCHYLVLPYQDGAQSAVLSLAYQYHKPVIVSDIESFRDTVVDNTTGFFFNALSHESLTAVMRDAVLRHDTAYDALTQNVRNHVKKEYSIDDILAQYHSFLDKTLRSGQSATLTAPSNSISD